MKFVKRFIQLTTALSLTVLLSNLISVVHAKEVIYFNNFEQHSQVGKYTRQMWQDDFDAPGISDGLEKGWLEIAQDSQQGKVLRIHYPKGGRIPRGGGVDFKHQLGQSYNELYMGYKVKFSSDFNWSQNGKLNGLAGGAANSGGKRVNGYNGWSARVHWHKNGKMSSYLYHLRPADEGDYGKAYSWDDGSGGQKYFQKGKWHDVVLYIKMNDVGQKNGVVKGWLDGQYVNYASGFEFRKTDAFAIDKLFISTFFGGTEPSLADVHADFDEFTVSQEMITFTDRPVVVTDPTPKPPSQISRALQSVTLIDAKADKPIPGFEAIESGDTIILDEMPSNSFNLRANLFAEGPGKSVRFTLDENYSTVESYEPLALFGDAMSNFHGRELAEGSHTLVVDVFDQRNAKGNIVESKTITFSVYPNRSRVGKVAIYAAGKPADSVYPKLELLLNNQVVSTFNSIEGNFDQNSFAEYVYTTDQPIDSGDIEIRYTNDNGERDVKVDKVVVDGQIYEMEAKNVFSSGAWTSKSGCTSGYFESEKLQCKGSFIFSHTQVQVISTEVPETSPTPGPKLGSSQSQINSQGIKIYAAGRPKDGIYPNLELRIKGELRAIISQVKGDPDSGNFNQYFYGTSDLNISPADISLTLTNDDSSRDVRIDRIVLNNTIYETEDPSVKSTGYWNGSRCGVGSPATEWLHCNGTITYATLADGVVSNQESDVTIRTIDSRSPFDVNNGDVSCYLRYSRRYQYNLTKADSNFESVFLNRWGGDPSADVSKHSFTTDPFSGEPAIEIKLNQLTESLYLNSQFISGTSKACLRYQVYVQPGFDWQNGGVLPGISTVSKNSSTKSFSDVSAVVHPQWGTQGDLGLRINNRVLPESNLSILADSGELLTGRWTTLDQEVVLSGEPVASGLIRFWLDEELILEANGQRLANTNSYLSGVVLDAYYGIVQGEPPSGVGGQILIKNVEVLF